jgi:hypothetical protein
MSLFLWAFSFALAGIAQLVEHLAMGWATEGSGFKSQ